MKTTPKARMRRNPVLKHWRAAGAALCLLLFGAGCETTEKYSLTHRLWSNDDMAKWSEPAPDPKLALAEDPCRKDVLVQYDALSEKHSKVKRQAYYLAQNQNRIAASKRPLFVSLVPANGLKPIPVVDPVAGTNALGCPSYAIITQDGRKFTLYQPAAAAEEFELPVYPETKGTALRVALTPFAAAGDVVMVGCVAAVVGFVLWVQSGAPGV